MGQIDTNKKLELIRDIRMSQQNNRAVMGRREQIVYGRPKPLISRGELYSLESTAVNEAVPAEADDTMPTLRSFKLRLLIAIILFAAFFFLDQTGQSIAGITSVQVKEAVSSESKDILSFITGLFNDAAEELHFRL